MPHLALDVIQVLADLLEDERASLWACCLTAPWWAHIFQQKLFRHVELNDNEKFQQFMDSVTNSPHVRPFVRSFQLNNVFFSSFDLSLEALKLLTKVTTLVLHNDHGHLDAEGFKQDKQIYTSFRMVHLTSLHLHNIRCFPYEIFAICTSLTKVFLEGGCIVHAEYYDGRLEVHPHADEFEDVEGFEVGPRLRELSIENNQYFTKLLIRENCLISLNQLQKLRLKLHDPGDVKQLASMIPLFGEALEELWLRLPAFSVHFLHLVENFLHPELFQNLRSFSMALDETPLDLVAPAWIASFLAALPNPQRFEELGIELLLSFGGYFQYHQVNAQDIGWRELDRILGLDRFPWLSGVEVSLYEELANRRVPLSQDKADEFLEAVLPNSWANGIVSVA